MSNNIWLSTTVERHLMVPAYGRVMGDVRPETAANAGSVKRHTDAFQATTPGSGQPWSPPVT